MLHAENLNVTWEDWVPRYAPQIWGRKQATLAKCHLGWIVHVIRMAPGQILVRETALCQPPGLGSTQEHLEEVQHKAQWCTAADRPLCSAAGFSGVPAFEIRRANSLIAEVYVCVCVCVCLCVCVCHFGRLFKWTQIFICVCSRTVHSQTVLLQTHGRKSIKTPQQQHSIWQPSGH